MPKVSIIMPMLNSIKFLDECILSVLNQTLRDIEIIIVDAGSTDGTLEKLLEYEKNDGRIRILKSDKKSMGYQYNMGIKAAKGEYIGFVESDDYIMIDTYEKLYNYIADGTVDWVKSNYYFFMEYPKYGRMMMPVKENRDIIYGEIFCPQEKVVLFTKERYMWNGIYNREYLLKNNIYLNETPGAAFQDMGFFLQAYMYAKRAVYLDDCLYCYRRDNPGSSMYLKKSVIYTVNETEYVAKIIRKDPRLYQLFWKIHCINSYQYFRSFYGELLEEKNYSDELYGAIRRYQSLCRLDDFCYDDEEVEWLIESVSTYDRKIKELWVKEEKLFRTQMQEILLKSKIAIMGCGDIGVGLLSVLLRLNRNEVICISDNDELKWGQEIMGIPVVSPQEMLAMKPDAVVVANRYCAEDVKQELLSIGAIEDKVHIGPIITRFRGTSVLLENDIIPIR